MGYMVKGWARMYFEGFGEMRVEAGDTWYQPPGVKHELLEYSDDWEVIEITMPAEFETHGRGPVAAQVPGVGRPSWT